MDSSTSAPCIRNLRPLPSRPSRRLKTVPAISRATSASELLVLAAPFGHDLSRHGTSMNTRPHNACMTCVAAEHSGRTRPGDCASNHPHVRNRHYDVAHTPAEWDRISTGGPARASERKTKRDRSKANKVSLKVYPRTLSNYAVFEGRTSRKEFWTFTIVRVLVIAIIEWIEVFAFQVLPGDHTASGRV